jgi:hypothetical protein
MDAGWDGMGWDGMGWDGVGWTGMCGWSQAGLQPRAAYLRFLSLHKPPEAFHSRLFAHFYADPSPTRVFKQLPTGNLERCGREMANKLFLAVIFIYPAPWSVLGAYTPSWRTN